MEKLRSKASSFKSLVETAKNIRMAMLVSTATVFEPIVSVDLVAYTKLRIF